MRYHRHVIAAFIGAAAIAGGIAYAHNGRTHADYAQPPGATDPRVTQSDIDQTICVSGYTATVRPPSSYTSALKAQQMKARHLPGNPADYEEDHSIPLELGGDPVAPDNLWPQPWTGDNNAHVKDIVENQLHRAVCNGSMTLADAQSCIRKDWTACKP